MANEWPLEIKSLLSSLSSLSSSLLLLLPLPLPLPLLALLPLLLLLFTFEFLKRVCFYCRGNLYYNGNAGVAGIAYLNSVCSSYKVSLNEEDGFFEGAHILAHEVGHKYVK